MDEKVYTSSPAGVSRRSDPELLTLVLGVIGGLAGLASLAQFRDRQKERRISGRRQQLVRHRAWTDLQELLAALHEWKNILNALRGLYEVGRGLPGEAEIRLGGALVGLPKPEYARFRALSFRMHRCQQQTTAACAKLQGVLEDVAPIRMNEVETIEAFQEELNGVLNTFNRNVFAIPSVAQAALAEPIGALAEFRAHEVVLEALAVLVRDAEKALLHLESTP